MVRKELKDFFLITEKLYNLLQEEITVKNRAEIIEKIDLHLEEREQIINKIVPPYTEEEKAKGKEIIKKNKVIDKRINEIFQQLKKEMQQTKQRKRSNESYENPYKSVQVMDGMFLDQKK